MEVLHSEDEHLLVVRCHAQSQDLEGEGLWLKHIKTFIAIFIIVLIVWDSVVILVGVD